MLLDLLLEMVQQLEKGTDLVIVGDIGLTSHIADVVRKAGHPARVERAMAA